ncbi:response regulator [Aquabacterium sp. A7-Y]|uniref:response regulator n=1 Tax=Aquabacterium sp. A7-Y TaxID=1349605 RepID=UPI00223E6840|nr:response regulator [Aquabacterium sp. A7-Y]MCW7541923.1 response regulator [Aquabacterium sp. A7-Y]
MAKILLIDDDELLRDTVLQMLELDGHRVVEAVGGREGLDRFEAEHFDLVITDVLMPGMDGAELIVELRRRGAALPILAISGGRRVLSPEFNLQTASLAGATLQLCKPFNRGQLKQAVQEALAS